mgnify:FL=1
MSNMALSLQIDIDAAQAKAELEKIKANLETLSKTSPDPKVKSEIQSLVTQLNQMDKAITETEKVTKEWNDTIRQVEKTSTELSGKLNQMGGELSTSEVILKDTGIAGKEAAENLKKIADGATIDKLKEIGESFVQISERLTELGKDFISEAEEGKHFEQEIKNLTKSTGEAEQALKQIKEFSDSAPLLDDDDIIKVGAEMVKFKVDIKETLPVLAQFAQSHQENITTPSDVVIKSLSGVRGGLQQLASQYGATKEVLAEYGAVVLSSGELDKDDLKTKQAVIAWMKEQRGEYTELTKSTMEYNKITGDLRKEVGKELIPLMITLNKTIVDIIKYYNSWAEENKKLAISASAVVIGVTAIGGALVGAGLYIASTIASIGSLIVTFTGASTAAAGLGVIWTGLGATFTAIGVEIATFAATIAVIPVLISAAVAAGLLLVKWTYDYKKAVEELPKKDMENALDAQAKAIEKLKTDFPGITSAQEAYNQARAKGFENILNEENGQKKLIDLTKALATEEQTHQRKKEEALKEEARLKELIDNTYYGDPKLKVYEGQLAAQKEVVNNEQSIIDKLREEKQGIYDATDAYIAKGKASAGQGIGSPILEQDLQEELKRQGLLTDTKKQNYSDQIANLENFKQQYQLTEMQILEIDKEIATTEEKIETGKKQNATKALQEEKRLQSERQNNLNLFLKDLKISLRDGEITQQDYFTAIKQYETEYGITEQNNKKLWLQLENSYSEELKTIQNKRITEQKKADQEAEKQEKERRKLAAEYEKEQIREQKAIEADRKNAVREELSLYEEIYKSELKIGDSKATSLQNYQKEIDLLNYKVSIQQGLVDSEAVQGEQLKAKLETGQYLSDKEREILSTYLKDKSALEALNNEYAGLLNKSIQLYNQEIANLQAYEDVLVKRGLISKEAAEKEVDNYKQAYKKAWDTYITPILEKDRTSGYPSLSEEEKTKVKAYNQILDSTKKTTSEIKTNIDGFSSATNNATNSVNKMNAGLQETNKQATELTKTMSNIGNITAGQNPYGSTGNFMSVEEAFSGLLSSAPEGGYGHFDDYSNAVKNSMVGEGYGVGRGNLTDKDKEIANYFNSQSKVTIPSSINDNYGASRSSQGWDRGANGFGYGQGTGGTVINNNYSIGNNVPASPAIQRSASDLQANVSSYPGYNNLILT